MKLKIPNSDKQQKCPSIQVWFLIKVTIPKTSITAWNKDQKELLMSNLICAAICSIFIAELKEC